MRPNATWHGDQMEAFALMVAFTHNCGCEFKDVYRVSACEAHQAMTYDQRFLDGLVFMRRFASKLLQAEWMVE